MKLFLAPHNDDETLFGTFTLIREKPVVVVVLKGTTQAHYGIDAEMRTRETAAAMEILGIFWHQWEYPDNDPPWPAVVKSLYDANLKAEFAEDPIERVWAPAIEEGGHPHHNTLGEIADAIFADKVTHYLTYTNGRSRSEGRSVPFEREWIGLKLRALACYESQIKLESTGHHFVCELKEYYQP